MYVAYEKTAHGRWPMACSHDLQKLEDYIQSEWRTMTSYECSAYHGFTLNRYDEGNKISFRADRVGEWVFIAELKEV